MKKKITFITPGDKQGLLRLNKITELRSFPLSIAYRVVVIVNVVLLTESSETPIMSFSKTVKV